MKHYLKRLIRWFKKSKQRLTRQQKRSVRINYNGKEMPAIRYLQLMSRKLPRMKHNKNGKYMNHFTNLKKIYYNDGLKQVNRYITVILKKMKSDSKKTA